MSKAAETGQICSLDCVAAPQQLKTHIRGPGVADVTPPKYKEEATKLNKLGGNQMEYDNKEPKAGYDWQFREKVAWKMDQPTIKPYADFETIVKESYNDKGLIDTIIENTPEDKKKRLSVLLNILKDRAELAKVYNETIVLTDEMARYECATDHRAYSIERALAARYDMHTALNSRMGDFIYAEIDDIYKSS